LLLLAIISSTIVSKADRSFFCLSFFESIISSAIHQLLNNSSITNLELVELSSSLFTRLITFANSHTSKFNSEILISSSDSFIKANNIVVI
jgi:hypothetical protein